MTKGKLVAGIGLALGVTLFAGWAWGAIGRSAVSRQLEASELRDDLLGARAAILDARVALYVTNFGEASQHLERARGLLRRADVRMTSVGRTADSEQLAVRQAGAAQVPDQFHLDGIGVLQLVDEHEAEAALDRLTFINLYPFLPAHFEILLQLLGRLARKTGGLGLRSAIKVLQDVLIDRGGRPLFRIPDDSLVPPADSTSAVPAPAPAPRTPPVRRAGGDR